MIENLIYTFKVKGSEFINFPRNWNILSWCMVMFLSYNCCSYKYFMRTCFILQTVKLYSYFWLYCFHFLFFFFFFFIFLFIFHLYFLFVCLYFFMCKFLIKYFREFSFSFLLKYFYGRMRESEKPIKVSLLEPLQSLMQALIYSSSYPIFDWHCNRKPNQTFVVDWN